MITNKDIRVENGNLVLNGDKFPLDGQSPETIMEIVEDNSDTTPTENSTAPITSGGVFTADKAISDTIGDITQTGITGATVAAQLEALDGAIKKTTVNTSTSANGNILIEMLQSEKTVLGCLLTRTDTGAGIISDLYTYDVSGTLYWGAHCRDANAAGAAVASTAVTGYVYYIDKPAINS